MNTDFVLNEWVPALRSGKYRQGKKALRNADDAYCCLGVACDLLRENGLLPEWEHPFRDSDYLMDGHVNYLPQRAVEFVGLDDLAGGFPGIKTLLGRSNLGAANDHGGKTFAEIADALETAARAEAA